MFEFPSSNRYDGRNTSVSSASGDTIHLVYFDKDGMILHWHLNSCSRRCVSNTLHYYLGAAQLVQLYAKGSMFQSTVTTVHWKSSPSDQLVSICSSRTGDKISLISHQYAKIFPFALVSFRMHLNQLRTYSITIYRYVFRNLVIRMQLVPSICQSSKEIQQPAFGGKRSRPPPS